MKRTLLFLLLFITAHSFSQTRIVMDSNARIVISNNAFVVVDNANPNAITDNSSNCGIISEGENNRIRWNVGAGTGAFSIPFYDDDNALRIPLTFTISTGGAGGGFIDFSSFDGSTWDNNTYRPSMVTHTQLYYPPSTTNNSDKMTDRFWLLNAQNFTTKPSGSLIFTYIDAENTPAGNSISESLLSAKRFNSGSEVWSDMLNNGTANTAANTVTTTNIPSADLFAAWTLVDPTCSIGGTTASSNGPLCDGSSLNLSASGGTSYSWTGPASFTSNVPNPVINPADPSASGTYTVIITNDYNCKDTLTVTVVVNDVTANAGLDQSITNGQSTTLGATASGGSGSYSYVWSPAGSLVDANLQNPQTIILTSTTTFTVTLTDITTGCTSTDDIVVTITGSVLSANATSNPDTICQGQTVQLYSNAGGGSGAYTYTWTSVPAGFTSGSASPTDTPLQSTTYYLTVGDGVGTVTTSVSVIVNSVPTATALSNSPVCENKNIDLQSSGGSIYLWSGPGGFTSTDPNPVINPALQANAGTYTVTVTNDLGCTAVATTVIVVNPVPVITVSSNSPVCIGSILNLTVSGGTSWSWTGPNSFTSISPNPAISPVTSADAGTYTVVATSADGCSTTGTTIVTTGGSLTITQTSNSPLCEVDDLLLSASGGTTFLWSGPNIWTANTQAPTITSVTTTMAGTYYVTVSDVSGCTGTGAVGVVINPLPSGTANNSGPLCEGGSLMFTSSNDSSNTYNWSGPNSFTSAISNPSINNVTLVNAGVYSVTITQSGCSVILTTTAVVNAAPVINATSNSPVCEGNDIILSSMGGGTYSWTGPAGFTSSYPTTTIDSALQVNGGVYTVIVTGTTGCTASQSVTVNVEVHPVVTCSNNNPDCPGDPIMLISSGGSSYFWLGPNGFTSSEQNPIILTPSTSNSGTYYVTVSNAVGCSSLGETTVNYPLPITISGVVTQNPADHMGEIDITANGGLLPYTFLWSNGSTTEDITGLFSGPYVVTLTDAGLCAISDTFVVDIPLIIPNAITPNADGINDDFEIINIGVYEKITLEIFNRWGDRLFVFSGSGAEYASPENRWDGTHNGKDLPMGSYLYILLLDEMDPITGAVMLKY